MITLFALFLRREKIHFLEVVGKERTQERGSDWFIESNVSHWMIVLLPMGFLIRLSDLLTDFVIGY